MEAVWRCRGGGGGTCGELLDGTGDSGRGSMPSCSGLRNGEGAPASDNAKATGSSGGGYVGVVVEFLEWQNGQSECSAPNEVPGVVAI